MKTAPIAAAGRLVLAQMISGCSESSGPLGSELAFDCLEIDGVTSGRVTVQDNVAADQVVEIREEATTP